MIDDLISYLDPGIAQFSLHNLKPLPTWFVPISKILLNLAFLYIPLYWLKTEQGDQNTGNSYENVMLMMRYKLSGVFLRECEV